MDDSAANSLVVDDNTIIHSLFESVCDRYNLNIQCVINGQEAVDVLAGEKKRSKRTPIIAISGTTMSNPSFKCLGAGMDDFIAKPIALNAILDVLLPLVKKDVTKHTFKNEMLY